MAHTDDMSALTTATEIDFQQVCDLSPTGMAVVEDGVLRYVNRSLATHFACQPQQLLGGSLIPFLHPQDQSAFELCCRWAPDEEPAPRRVAVRILGSCGKEAHAQIYCAPMGPLQRQLAVLELTDVSDRLEAEETARDRLRFERLLADLSASFVNLPAAEIDARIGESLVQLVEFLGNDRSTLVEFDADPGFVHVRHSHAVGDCAAFPRGRLPATELPWFIDQFRQGKLVFVRDLPDDLPPEAAREREYCLQHGIKSNVTLPLKAGGVALGALTFAFFRKRCEWGLDVLLRLQLIGEVFASAMLRRRTEDSLREALAQNERLREQLEEENQFLRDQVTLKRRHDRILGKSEVIRRALAEAECVAPTDAPVLLSGETGTGKELLAQTIHELSSRKRRAMVVVNCASLPATLVESELFGREAGAYTGAASAQIGRFLLADKSTLFLDEIGEFPIELQAKLLRVLEDGRFERLGSPATVKVDVRIIAATNRDLQKAVRDGQFRADLYHRLSVFPIRLPPLRERREDIPQLAWAFVEALGKRMGKPIRRIPRQSMEALQAYSWPGNVRELSNVIERAMILTQGDTLHLAPPSDVNETRPSSVEDEKKSLREVEREQILRVLQETGWRIRGAGGAAAVLDMKPTTLEARMVRLGIQRPQKNSIIS